jgi:hypothetical protein
MADRYWVGGTGSWDATTTNWSATNGGAGGASVPTASDDVFFTTLSNATAYVCTLTTAPTCRSVSIVGPAAGNVTIAGTANWSVYGSFTLAATGVTFTYTTGIISFLATTTGFTITTNGNSLNAAFINFNGAGGAWTLGSALTNTNSFQVLAGTVSTANFNVTTGNLLITGAVARTVTLGSSSVTCVSWNVTGSNTTVNAGTSTITLTGAAGTFFGGGFTYYNVTKANNGFAIGDGGNTFNALTMSTVTVAGTFVCSFAGNQTIGTLTINGGGTANGRASIQTTAALAGTQITLTVGTFVTNGRVDFRDINFAGAASPLTVATGGDCGNNTNITLATPKTVYWNLPTGGTGYNTTTAAWALTSGGAPSNANFPLPQDTAIFEDTGLNSGVSIAMANSPNIGTINTSTRTLPMTFSMTTFLSNIYGDLTLSSAVTITGTTGGFVFSGYNKTQTITSSGATVEAGMTVNNLSTTTTLSGALTLGTTRTFTLTQGTLNLNAQTITTGLFSSTGAGVRSITFGGGTMVTSGATYTVSGSNFTTSGLGTISMTSASSKTFAGGGFSYPTLNQGGAGALVITGANTFANMTNTVQPATITFPASTTTTVSAFNVNGTAGNLVTLNSSTPGTRFTLFKAVSDVVANYLSISDSRATLSDTWYAQNSTDGGNNIGWIFFPDVLNLVFNTVLRKILRPVFSKIKI